ncbi:hypothetical protein E2562_025982 [Oryza meyeriana var. granulata]|uniref:DUF4283 domain-containing protein n=1 Tax=Oryza meyeriana var. granulata TaxID=110450 RepID=A0A6G1EZ24_9ORYZ|nr:hypothetical protein E2562_025982 [Oryza meyeriana var. granulata]
MEAIHRHTKINFFNLRVEVTSKEDFMITFRHIRDRNAVLRRSQEIFCNKVPIAFKLWSRMSWGTSSKMEFFTKISLDGLPGGVGGRDRGGGGEDPVAVLVEGMFTTLVGEMTIPADVRVEKVRDAGGVEEVIPIARDEVNVRTKDVASTTSLYNYMAGGVWFLPHSIAKKVSPTLTSMPAMVILASSPRAGAMVFEDVLLCSQTVPVSPAVAGGMLSESEQMGASYVTELKTDTPVMPEVQTITIAVNQAHRSTMGLQTPVLSLVDMVHEDSVLVGESWRPASVPAIVCPP